jgi:uncharacterized repeat protein (TIGR03803 family)
MRLKSICTAVGIGLFLGAGLPGHAQVLTLHSFTGTPDGANPLQLVWANGVFYGSTFQGGANDQGSLFSFNTNGSVFSTIYNFTGDTNNGGSPNNVLVAGSTIYGTLQNGGTNYMGTIYAVGTNGLGFTPLYSFGRAPDGEEPQGGLILSGSTLYGTTYVGGAATNGGTVFKINTDGTGYSILHSFTNLDGVQPQGALVLGGTILYGITHYGGTNGNGTIFAVDTSGNSFAVLHSFTNAPDPYYPASGLVLDAGILYGTSISGGANTNGAIYAINTNGSGFRVLHSFSATTGNTDGKVSQTTLSVSGSYLYGAATSGGANGGGTLFLINTNGNGFTVLTSFMNTNASGWDPLSGPIRVGNSLWGTTYNGNASVFGTLYQLPLPAITSQPQNLTVTNTSPATFTVSVADDSPVTYQWYLNTNNLLSGQTTNILTLASATNSGAYTVVVSDNFGSVTSSPAVLTVITPGSKPVITQNPQNDTVLSGNTASFTNAASGPGTLFYQWYYNTNTLLSGQTGAILVLPSVSPTQQGYYTVVVTNLYGNATSTPAFLTVLAGSAPSITQQPQNYTVTNGQTATFTNVASGTGQLIYQWYFNTNTPVSGGTGAILVLPSVSPTQQGYYTVVVTNLYGRATSAPALLTVITPSGPTITQQPQNYTVTNGQTATFTNVASGTGQLFYQWYFNTNTPVSGATGAILTISPATTNNGGYYTVIVTNLYGSATSVPALLTVIATLSPPLITQQPQDYTVTNGYNATFTNVASGTGPLSYQWYFNTNTPVVGGTNAILLITFATTNQVGSYRVIVTNVAGSATSSPASLAVISTRPIIFVQPQSQTVTNGQPFSFSVVVAGKSPLRYQWYTNTVSRAHELVGATGSTLTFASASANLLGNYLVTITNSLGSVTSSPALLSILTTPVMTLQPQDVVVTNGDPVSFTAAAVGAGVLNYQWYFQTNTVLTGATSTSLMFTNAIASVAGYYSVRVTNTFGSVTSTYALLSISNQLNFLSFTFANGSASFAVANTPNSANRLWASSNLTSASFWQVIATDVMATNGLWFYTDPSDARTNSARFYRFSSP